MDTSQRHVAATKSCIVHPRGHRIPSTFCLFNMSVGRGTCRGDIIAAKFVLHGLKIIRTHEGTYRCDMSRYISSLHFHVSERFVIMLLLHVPATYTFLLHVPYEWTSHVLYVWTTYDFAAAAMPLRHVSSCVGTFKYFWVNPRKTAHEYLLVWPKMFVNTEINL